MLGEKEVKKPTTFCVFPTVKTVSGLILGNQGLGFLLRQIED